MQLSRQFSAIAETLLKLPHAKIAKLISLVLFIYIAYLLAKITWLFLDETPQYNQSMSHGSVIKSNSARQNISLSGIYSLNLFGLYNESNVVEEADEIEDAPETNLNLTLTGVVASNEDDRSAAIIQNNGAQEIYAIDETINGTRAVLKNVYNDRVHIRHSGRLETLMLDGFDYNESKSQIKVARRKEKANISGPILQSNTPKRVDQRNNNELTKQAQALRDDISADPGKITDYLKIGPKRVNGQIVGYQLMPGKNPDFFKSSGLKSGDVAIQMNGYDLSQPSEAAQALRALKQEREVSLLVNRNDDITEILFSIDNSID